MASRARGWLAPLAALLLAGCATQDVGDGYPLRAVAMAESGRGAWIEARGARSGIIEGEYITSDQDSLWVLDLRPGARPGLRAVAMLDLQGARIERWRTSESALYGMGMIGSVTTISNGYFLAITAPIWWISSAVGGVEESRSAQLSLGGDGWGEIRRWARFPAGWPPGLAAADRARFVGRGDRPGVNDP